MIAADVAPRHEQADVQESRGEIHMAYGGSAGQSGRLASSFERQHLATRAASRLKPPIEPGAAKNWIGALFCRMPQLIHQVAKRFWQTWPRRELWSLASLSVRGFGLEIFGHDCPGTVDAKDGRNQG